MLELRKYESHSEERARKKIDMFNNGETAIFPKCGFENVFFGEALVGPRLPNLQYMLAAPDMAANEAGWKAFLAHPDFTAMKNDPQYADTIFHLGTALAEQRRWEDAAAAYRRAIALPRLSTPDLAYQNLGLALYHLKRYREAEESLRFALHLEPQLQAAHYSLGLVLAAGSRRDEARAAFRRARELGADSPFGQAAVKQLKELGEGG